VLDGLNSDATIKDGGMHAKKLRQGHFRNERWALFGANRTCGGVHVTGIRLE
jgi:hypothetical protein